MKRMHEPIKNKATAVDDDTINRGVTGQNLRDASNPPGDMHQGTPGAGGDVNLNFGEMDKCDCK